MAWVDADWITQATAALRWSKLLTHIEEVSQAITVKYQSDGTSVDAAVVSEYYEKLLGQKDKYDPGGAAGHGGGSRLVVGKIIK